jgi:hypothetical protein
MCRSADLLALFLTVATLLGCGFLGLIGVGIAALGLSAFVVGIHGGPLMAGVMLLFGAALAFIAYYLAKLFFRSERKKVNSVGS